MKYVTSRRNSIYFRLAKLLLAAFVIAGVCFLALNISGEYLIYYCFESSEFVTKENNKRIENLQKYVTDHHISTTDSDKLTKWVKEQRVIYIRIYKGHTLSYDSNYPDVSSEAYEEEDYYAWESVYQVKFEDGEADVLINGLYTYEYYNYALIAEILISFGIFIGIVMFGIRGTIRYIQKLSKEIGILEGGDLDYQITIAGHDELTALAISLDDMRKSFREQVEQEALLTMANKKIITEMSHDLRTPLTALLIYAEVLKKRKYRDEAQMWEYIEKLNKKAHQIKQLSDHIFEYALVSSEEEVILEEPQTLRTVFYDPLSEMASYLEQQGYRTVLDVQWEEKKIRICSDYIVRILDNITSNITKYADADYPIMISSVSYDGFVGISFENHKQRHTGREESTHIGIRNIENMMPKMDGVCEVRQSDETFRIILLFKSV